MLLSLLASTALAQSSGMLSCPLGPNWSAAPPEHRRAGSEANYVDEMGGGLRWNGAPIDEARLRQYAGLTTMLRPRPIMVLNMRGLPDCERFQALQRIIEAVADCEPGICQAGELSYPPYPSPPPPPPPPPPPRRR